MLQHVCSIFYRSVLKPKRVSGTTGSVPCEMADKSLCVKLVIVSLLEHSLNQRTSHFRFVSSTRIFNTDKSFGSFTFKPDIALPNVR